MYMENVFNVNISFDCISVLPKTSKSQTTPKVVQSLNSKLGIKPNFLVRPVLIVGNGVYYIEVDYILKKMCDTCSA